VNPGARSAEDIPLTQPAAPAPPLADEALPAPELRELLLTVGPFLLLAVALLALAYWWLQPQPPRQVVLATGAANGAYVEFGRRYAERLKLHGITVQLRETEGAAQNLGLLRDPASGVDIAFVQGGAIEDAAGTAADEHLVSLGSMFHEPLWLFYRDDAAQRLVPGGTLTSLAQLPGWRLNIGTVGSGVPAVMKRLIEANGLAADQVLLQTQARTPAVADLLEGRIDAVALASAPESSMVQMLLGTPGIRIAHFAQAEAYSRRFPFLSPVVLPRGVVDLARDKPSRDVHLVAPTATLVARDTLHPALIQLFVQAAQQVHGGAGWFQRQGEFPNATDNERPLASEAQRYYRSGVPLLQRYLPFWLANLIDRMWVALLSIVAVLIPLSRVLPPLYEYRVRRRIFRWYGRLRAVEEAQGQRPLDELLEELNAIDRRVGRLRVPLSHADELYGLRSHIHGVRKRLQAGPQGIGPTPRIGDPNEEPTDGHPRQPGP
jgi:TRAP-type uncharacterized transport system substrate-binding protein